MKALTLSALLIGLTIATIAQEDTTKSFGDKLTGIFKADSSDVEENLLISDAEVLVGDNPIKNAQVIVYKGDAPIDTVYTNEKGTFNLKLPFDHLYVLEFSKAGYVTKKLEVDATGMLAEDKAGGYDLGRFKMSLFRTTKDMDLSVYETPIARYYYDGLMQQFQVDRKHLKKKQKEIEKVQEANEKLLADREERKDEIEEEYNILIRDADLEFEANNLEYAKELYNDALKIMPEAGYPRQQIILIDKKLKRDLNKEDKYKLLVAKADESMKNKNLMAAKESYQEALNVFPDRSYPKTKLGEIESMLAEGSTKERAKDEYSLEGIEVALENQDFSASLARKYPQGLTVERIEEDGKVIERRIIIDGNKGVEYQKVTHNWGGQYYFKNSGSITQFIYETEAFQLNE